MGKTKHLEEDEKSLHRNAGHPQLIEHERRRKKMTTRGKIKDRSDAPAVAPEPQVMPDIRRTTAYIKNSLNSEWPALLGKHLSMVESHVLILDQLMQSMQSESKSMAKEDRLDWELGEMGNWRAICRMMDTSREMLAQAREVAKGILPTSKLQDKKGFGLQGTSFEKLEPLLQAKAEMLGYDPRGKGCLRRRNHDGVVDAVGSRSIIDSSSESSKEDEIPKHANFISLNKTPRKLFTRKKTTQGKAHVAVETPADTPQLDTGVRSNPRYMVDVNQTPVHGVETLTHVARNRKQNSQDQTKEKKKKTRLAEHERKAVGQTETETGGAGATTGFAEAEVDFAALEAQLQAEIAACEQKNRQETLARIAEANLGMDSKKRRRSSDEADQFEKMVKKEKLDKENEKKRKKKKRKADECTLDEIGSAMKKKRKHKKDA